MQRIIILICVFIALISCGKHQEKNDLKNSMSEVFERSDFLRVLHDSAHYGDTHAYSECHGRYWEVFGEPNNSIYFGAMTRRITIQEFDSITEILNKSFGKSTYDDTTAPIDTSYFWMGTKSYTKYYYWCTSNVLIAWGLFEAESGMGYAWLNIYVGYTLQNESCDQEPKQCNPIGNDTNDISINSQNKTGIEYDCTNFDENSCLLADHQTSYPQISSFADYVFEEHLVFMPNDSESIGHLRQIDIEFPTGMKNKKVLAKIQEKLIDTLFYQHYHTTKLDRAIAQYWGIEPDKIERKLTYPLIVPNDSDEYLYYNGVSYNMHFEHFCGRTSFNQNGLYIMRRHYTWFDGGCHHYPNTSYIAFDTQTGEFIHFWDIFSEEYVDDEKHMILDIEYYVRSALLDKYSRIALQYWYDGSFTITPTSLVLHYTHFTLGCWADGEHEVEIPLSKVAPLLNPKWKHLIRFN